VNNAGGSLHTPYRFLDEDETHWQRVMDLNVMGAVRASRAVLPGMVERGFGRIINFGSKAGRFGSLIAGPNYSAAKGAMAALTRQLAQEFGPHSVTVNCICPGVVMTDRTQALWNERRSAQERERVLQEVPLRRHAEVEETYHRVFGGRIDMGLSQKGQDQAAALAGWLRNRRFDTVYASPMQRVQLTLAPFRQHHPGEPVLLEGLREVDFGVRGDVRAAGHYGDEIGRHERREGGPQRVGERGVDRMEFHEHGPAMLEDLGDAVGDGQAGDVAGAEHDRHAAGRRPRPGLLGP
jgi:broad specificity phosphatase PhoE